MAFTIKKDSTSFRYLSRWKSNYKDFAHDGKFNFEDTYGWEYSRDIAGDFCSYYRTVGLLALLHFAILSVIPGVIFQMCIGFGLFDFDKPSFGHILAVLYAALSTMVVAVLGLFCVVYFIREVAIPFIVENWPKRKTPTRKKFSVPGLFATWYDQHKHKYCATVEYEVAAPEVEQDSEDATESDYNLISDHYNK